LVRRVGSKISEIVACLFKPKRCIRAGHSALERQIIQCAFELEVIDGVNTVKPQRFRQSLSELRQNAVDLSKIEGISLDVAVEENIAIVTISGDRADQAFEL